MMQVVTEEELIERSKFPRVTLDDLEANIRSVAYDYEDLTVKCTIVLKNGFSVHGVSACAVPGNWKKDVGERLALADAKNKIWAFMGYDLKNKVVLAQALVETLSCPAPGYRPYVGMKAVWAQVCDRGSYNVIRGWTIPENEDPSDEGYILTYPDGYVSWSPKKQFEEAYQVMDVMGEGAFGGPTWLDRLQIEHAQLKARVDALRVFITGKLFTGIGADQQDLLKQQYETMNTYLDILETRMVGG